MIKNMLHKQGMKFQVELSALEMKQDDLSTSKPHYV